MGANMIDKLISAVLLGILVFIWDWVGTVAPWVSNESFTVTGVGGSHMTYSIASIVYLFFTFLTFALARNEKSGGAVFDRIINAATGFIRNRLILFFIAGILAEALYQLASGPGFNPMHAIKYATTAIIAGFIASLIIGVARD